jgi:hypothetical protein
MVPATVVVSPPTVLRWVPSAEQHPQHSQDQKRSEGTVLDYETVPFACPHSLMIQGIQVTCPPWTVYSGGLYGYVLGEPYSVPRAWWSRG